MLNRPGTKYNNPDAAKIQDLEDEIRDLQRSNNRLRGVSNNNPSKRKRGRPKKVK